MNPQFDELGPRLRALRRCAFKSQSAFARQCAQLGVPVTRNLVANWESGRTDIPAPLIPVLAHVLKARVRHLLPEFGKPAPSPSRQPASAFPVPTPAKLKSNADSRVSSLGWLKHPLLKKIFSPFLTRRSGITSSSK